MKFLLLSLLVISIYFQDSILMGQKYIPIDENYSSYLENGKLLPPNDLLIESALKSSDDKVFTIEVNYKTEPCRSELLSIDIRNAQFPLTWYELDPNGHRINPVTNPPLSFLKDETTYVVMDLFFHMDTVFVDFEKTFQLENIFPNPALSHLDLEFSVFESEDLHLQLFNSIGQPIFSSDRFITPHESTFRLKLDNLSAGIYYLKISTICDSKLVKVVYLDMR